MAQRHLAEIADGADPMEERLARRQMPTVEQWGEEYMLEVCRRKKQPRHDRRYLGMLTKKWGRRAVDQLTRRELKAVKKIARKMKTSSPIHAEPAHRNGIVIASPNCGFESLRGESPLKSYQMICVPDWLGSTKKTGVEHGPAFLEEHLRRSVFRPECLGKSLHIPVEDPDPQNARGLFASCKYLPEIIDGSQRTRDAVAGVVEDGHIPLVLMGNDSMMMGVFAGVSACIGQEYAVSYFDAHGDINTPESSGSGKIYGMPLAHSLGHGHPQLIALSGDSAALRHDRVALLGARALDPGEITIIQQHRLIHISTDDLNQPNRCERVSDVLESYLISGAKKHFIHIDLDVLEPKESPGVSMHEPNGLTVQALLEIFDVLMSGPLEIIGLSISEYTPCADREKKTLKIVTALVEQFISRTSTPG